jgi:hypothetical protein
MGGIVGGIVSSVAGNVVGGLIGSKGAKSAANIQAASADRATELQREQWLKSLELQKPFYEAGVAGENRLLDLLGLSKNTGAAGYGSLMRDFGMSDFQADPGYAFRMSEGLKGLDRTAASRGGLLSGAALKGAERYGQDLASQEYQNAFNRYQTNRANKLNPLQSLAGQGQTTANTLGTAGQTYATNAGNNYMNAGNARASGYVGSANAWSNAIGNAYNQYNQNQMMNQMFPQGGGGNTASYDMLPDSQSFDYYNNA